MRTIAVLFISALTLALPACHKTQAVPNGDNMSVIDNNLTAPPADVETLPPDESAGTANQITTDDLGDNDENDGD